jgi:predicted Rossmann fold flavoprotein
MTHPVIIIGAGAAGLMAAAELARAGRATIVLERGDRPGRKILASGGGRCNLTHDATPEELLAAYAQPAARFLKHAVYDVSPEALRAWFAEHDVPTVAEPDGCVFPESARAGDVLDALLAAPRGGQVELRTGADCTGIIVEGDRCTGVETSAGRLDASAVILAAGGPAWPRAGGSAAGHELLARLGHTVIEPRPGLVPLVVEEPWIGGLQGISLSHVRLTVQARRSFGGKAGRVAVEGPLVFTHRGLSGPAALDLSLHLEALPAAVRLSLLPDRTPDQLEQQLVEAASTGGSSPVRNLLQRDLPRRVAEHLLQVAGTAPDTQVGQLRRQARRRLAELLTAAELTVSRTAGWDQAMVTVGGCALAEIDPRTMRSRRVAALHVVGELLDVAGRTGGYNLHAAFATGRLAARAIVAP